jgi:hypothetical protein
VEDLITEVTPPKVIVCAPIVPAVIFAAVKLEIYCSSINGVVPDETRSVYTGGVPAVLTTATLP